jgi:hypothetical protein
MLTYSQATPTTTLLDNTTELDILNSTYANIRYSATVETKITIDSKYEANLPGLAYDYYGNQELWRAILAFNGLEDPFNDIIVGVEIYLPSLASIESYFTSSSNTLNPTVSL